jgi:hypothetical protein
MASSEPPAPVPWYHRPLGVLLLLFVVLGPLGLPYLWKSPRFSHRLKMVLTVLVIAYTAVLIEETIGVVRTVAREMNALGIDAPF